MKKITILIITIVLLAGCELKSEKQDYENIEDCRKSGGIAEVQYFGDTNDIRNVTCIYGVGD